jgi:hypothetical protein
MVRMPRLAHVAGICLLLSFQLAALPRTISGEVSAIPLTIVVSTSSDWTKLTFYNLTLLIWSCNLTSGKEAPQIAYSITFDTIAISKKQYDETNVTLMINALVELGVGKVVLLTEKGAIGNTTFTIFCEGQELAQIKSMGSVPGDEAINARLFDLTGIISSGRLETREIELSRTLGQPMVLAFYYPWYGNSEGKLFHWENVGYSNIGSSTFYPLFGPYDSRDVELIEAHLMLAKAAGLDGFICSWWGIDTFEDTALREILKVSNREGFNVTIYYESVRDLNQEQMVKELAYVLSSYSNEPSFLKIDGKPVIFLYAVSAYGRTPEFWKGIVEKAENLSGKDVLFLADTFDISYAESFDGFHTYNPIWISEGRLEDTYCSEAKVARVLGKFWAATVAPGYDDRKIRSPGTFVDRRNGEYYNSTWKGSIYSDPDFVLICTWNEWHEGTNVEPSREFGFDYLQLTNSWVSLFKGTSFGILPEAEPILNQSLWESNSSIVLELRNEGNGDAFAANVLINVGTSINCIASAICLPVNESCISLFVPMIRSNESFFTRMPLGTIGNFTIELHATYFSLSGKRYVSAYSKNLIFSETKEAPTDLQFLALLAPLPLLLIMIILIRRHAKRSPSN